MIFSKTDDKKAHECDIQKSYTHDSAVKGICYYDFFYYFYYYTTKILLSTPLWTKTTLRQEVRMHMLRNNVTYQESDWIKLARNCWNWGMNEISTWRSPSQVTDWRRIVLITGLSVEWMWCDTFAGKNDVKQMFRKPMHHAQKNWKE